MSATDNLGPHLLGYVAPAPDERDYSLEVFLAGGDDLDAAFDALVKSHAAVATKAWAKVAQAHIRKLEGGVNPTPAPTPVPTPTPVPVPTPTPAGDVLWGDPDQLDQGQTGHCVGFGCAQFCNTDPINDHYADADGHAVYYEAKVIDGEPNAENGSSVHSGIKALKNRGRVGTYAWTSSLATIKAWVQSKGPVVVGTDWMNDMFSPDASGFVKPTGALAGGHCYLIVGWSHDDVITFQNSWGSSFGLNGRFKMHAADFQTLVVSGFEACATVELALV